ncbi:zinc ribbon domain-containing protein [Kitasatospora indigofera]|uniref:zinc ribbon domain-containing protein n=1 Tax=Kitasatospora indigofera TaxID=67307 RepID=UPI0036BA8085
MILTSKAESLGREVMAMNPRNTTRGLPESGQTAKENRPTRDTFHYVNCGHTAHADTVSEPSAFSGPGPARRNNRQG